MWGKNYLSATNNHWIIITKISRLSYTCISTVAKFIRPEKENKKAPLEGSEKAEYAKNMICNCYRRYSINCYWSSKPISRWWKFCPWSGSVAIFRSGWCCLKGIFVNTITVSQLAWSLMTSKPISVGSVAWTS